MTKIELAHVQRLRDRHGRVRHYFRRPGFPRATLPGAPGSAEFMDAYRAALTTPAAAIGVERTQPGSISALLIAYYASAEFANLAPQTQVNYRNILERFRALAGTWPVAGMRRKDVVKLIDAKAATPGAARNFLKRLRKLLDFAVDRDWRADNPARAVKAPTTGGDGFRAWTEDDIDRFEQHWPTGSRARRALALLLYTGQRRSDVVTMGRQHTRDGKIRVTQVKRKPGARATTLLIPIHPTLKTELDATPTGDLAFIMTAYGKPMTPAGFSAWFAECATKAGLPKGCTPHGLRKAAARRLAEAGCSVHEIASITGHKSIKEVEHYARSASQSKLAEHAMAAISDVK